MKFMQAYHERDWNPLTVTAGSSPDGEEISAGGTGTANAKGLTPDVAANPFQGVV